MAPAAGDSNMAAASSPAKKKSKHAVRTVAHVAAAAAAAMRSPNSVAEVDPQPHAPKMNYASGHCCALTGILLSWFCASAPQNSSLRAEFVGPT